MSKRIRRNFTNDQKAALLKRHLVDGVPVSELCEKEGLQPSLFYRWQRVLFEKAGAVLEAPSASASNREKELEARIAQLEAKLARKDAVIADISEEHLKLKKELGEL